MKHLTPLQIIEAVVFFLLALDAFLVKFSSKKEQLPIIEDFEKHYSEN